RGSDRYLTGHGYPVESEAAGDLVRRARLHSEDNPLYVVSIAAITNVASAILLAPEIINNIVVVWLGGHPMHWNNTREFNLYQDVAAARVIFDSGVPVVQIPCMGVASHLLTSVPELETCLAGKNSICDTLVELFKGYSDDHFGWAKEIWDISAVAYLIDERWVPTDIVHSPIITDEGTWSKDTGRHFMKTASFVCRNEVFRDMFKKLAAKEDK
ncbi:MAG: nucleoside hydrolase, partial [Bacillota bacterium]|nr:nucleoside hydrolase [Bacillota bacterium]